MQYMTDYLIYLKCILHFTRWVNWEYVLIYNQRPGEMNWLIDWWTVSASSSSIDREAETDTEMVGCSADASRTEWCGYDMYFMWCGRAGSWFQQVWSGLISRGQILCVIGNNLSRLTYNYGITSCGSSWFGVFIIDYLIESGLFKIEVKQEVTNFRKNVTSG